MKKSITLIALSILTNIAYSQTVQYNSNSAFSAKELSQDFQFGKRVQTEVDMKSYNGDTSVHALGLNEYGKVFFISNTINYPMQFEYHSKIKIFDEKGFKYATVEVPLYNVDKNSFEKFITVKGITYNNDGNGEPQYTVFDTKTVQNIKIDEHRKVVKFTLPNVKKGSVIEYSYIIETPYINNLRTWNFQSDIPKLHSTYDVSIPRLFGYEVSLTGNQPLTRNATGNEVNCYYLNGVSKDCLKVVYGMDNIPAITEEPYMTSLKNYTAAIYFQLTSAMSISNFNIRNYDVGQDIARDWKGFDKFLINQDELGGQLKKKDPLKAGVLKAIAGKTGDLDKAKAVYRYVQKNYKWSGELGVFSYDGVKKSFEKHYGNVADINLALLSALNTAGIKAEPVLVSTRENGIINKELPNQLDLNYIISKVTIDNKTYFVDATESSLDFGELPLRVINDKGRVLNLAGEGYWVDIPAIQEKNTALGVELVQQGNKLKGTITVISDGYAAYEKRNAIKAFAGEKEYIDNVQATNKTLTITTSKILNADTTGLPVKEVYTVELILPADLSVNVAQFIINDLKYNPLKLNLRKYPLNLGMINYDFVNVSLQLEDGYAIEKAPAAIHEVLPNQGGKLDTEVQSTGGKFIFIQKLTLDKTSYATTEYPYVKAIYDKMISSQHTTFKLVKNKTGL